MLSLQDICCLFRPTSPQQFYILRINLDAYKQHLLQSDEQAFDFGAARGKQTSLIAVERSADDTYFVTVHLGGDFFRRIIARRFRGVYGIHKALHFSGIDYHRLAIASTPKIAILQCGCFLYNHIQVFARIVYEEQILYKRDFLAYFFFPVSPPGAIS